MATGLLVRDFVKVYRELRYANEGAIRLSEVEHNAYLNRLTLEITHYDAYRSINYKTNPENTHWGYATSFKGSSVISNIPIKFTRQRVFNEINQGIWNYHQATEDVDLNRNVTQMAANAIAVVGAFPEAGPKVIKLLIRASNFIVTQGQNRLSWILENVFQVPQSNDPEVSEYTAYPIASPFPDVWKFKSDIPVSFLFRLESWYLVNPAVYIVNNPTDTSDETEGEDEYPEPLAGNGDGNAQEFPTSSPNNPANDPRDGGQKPAPPLQSGTSYSWSGSVSGTALGSSGQPVSYSETTGFTALGNQFPFTAEAGPNTIITVGGVAYKNGYIVKDRFGQTVHTVANGVGWSPGALTISVTASV